MSASVDGAEQAQERVGDGSLGPSDVVSCTVLSVPKAELLAWARISRPDALEFYAASDLSPQTGWVGVARGRGKVYVTAMTN